MATVGDDEECMLAQGQMGAGPVLSGGFSAVGDGGSIAGGSTLRGKQRGRSEGGCRMCRSHGTRLTPSRRASVITAWRIVRAE